MITIVLIEWGSYKFQVKEILFLYKRFCPKSWGKIQVLKGVTQHVPGEDIKLVKYCISVSAGKYFF